NPSVIKEEDKKYLRVHYDVLERYPREKFKYEEDQIRVLQEIRDRMGESGGDDEIPIPDPFAEIRDRLQLSKDVFDKWRADFARCADRLAPEMAKILNGFRSF